jgi:hypothetical protein
MVQVSRDKRQAPTPKITRGKRAGIQIPVLQTMNKHCGPSNNGILFNAKKK